MNGSRPCVAAETFHSSCPDKSVVQRLRECQSRTGHTSLAMLKHYSGPNEDRLFLACARKQTAQYTAADGFKTL